MSALQASRIFLPGNQEYQNQNGTYLAAHQSEITPSAIFLPSNKEDVAKFIRLIKPFVKGEGFAFAIRGGGQNPLPYCANIEKLGVTLDMARLDQVTIGEGSVTIGAGARWGPVFEALDGTGFGVSGNRNAKAGIGGLTLQGMIVSVINIG